MKNTNYTDAQFLHAGTDKDLILDLVINKGYEILEALEDQIMLVAKQ